MGATPRGAYSLLERGIQKIAQHNHVSCGDSSVEGDMRKHDGPREGWQVPMSYAGQASLRRADMSWDMHHKKTLVIWGARAGVPGKTTSAKAQKWG